MARTGSPHDVMFSPGQARITCTTEGHGIGRCLALLGESGSLQRNDWGHRRARHSSPPTQRSTADPAAPGSAQDRSTSPVRRLPGHAQRRHPHDSPLKRLLLVTIITLSLGLVAGPAVAANAHVVKGPTQPSTATLLTVTASVAGLGNVPSAHFTLTGTIDVFSQCYNRGGHNPAADNKQEEIDVDDPETFGSATAAPTSR